MVSLTTATILLLSKRIRIQLTKNVKLNMYNLKSSFCMTCQQFADQLFSYFIILRKEFSFFISAAFTIVIVLGVIVAIQFLVFVFFACKGWDAVFG